MRKFLLTIVFALITICLISCTADTNQYIEDLKTENIFGLAKLEIQSHLDMHNNTVVRDRVNERTVVTTFTNSMVTLDLSSVDTKYSIESVYAISGTSTTTHTGEDIYGYPIVIHDDITFSLRGKTHRFETEIVLYGDGKGRHTLEIIDGRSYNPWDFSLN